MVVESKTTSVKTPDTQTVSDVRTLIPAMGLQEYWYPAIEDRKVKNKPIGLKFLGQQLVFFRGKDGTVAALWNVCPHRGGSLMHGDCHFDGTVSCPYHGWTFDGDGNALAVLPEGPESKIPGKVKARVYPTQTLRGMVFVWMGEGDPAPIEEDVPPEFFREDGIMMYAWEVWPVNWRQAVENAADAHVPYVHRDAMLVLMNPMFQRGPVGARSKIVNGRGAPSTPPQPRAGQSGAQEPRFEAKYRHYFPELGSEWPKHWWRGLWTWAFRWSGKRRYKNEPLYSNEEWLSPGGRSLHHTPAMVRLDYRTHLYTRANVPIDENTTRQIYIHYARGTTWLARLYEKLHFHIWHRWAMYSNFSVQDFRAAGPQVYDSVEYLSATDSHLVVVRRMFSNGRGLVKHDSDITPAEEFSHERQRETGMTPADWRT